MSEFLNRGTGLIIIEAVNSNPNGDPDRENDPRMRPDGRGEISPVSFKRKLRELVDHKDGPVWQELSRELKLKEDNYKILEKRGITQADRVKIAGNNNPETSEKEETTQDDQKEEDKNVVSLEQCWDARVFGNTILQENIEMPIKTGVAQFGLGVSVSPICIERLTTTRITPVQEEKSRGMAPLSFRVVQHAVYCMPFFINATTAKTTACSEDDIRLLLRLIPYAYAHTASYLRPQVNIRHAFYIEHNSPVGRFNDFEVIESLIPKRIGDKDKPSTSWSDYDDEDLHTKWNEIKEEYIADKKATENTRDLVQEMEHDKTSSTSTGA